MWFILSLPLAIFYFILYILLFIKGFSLIKLNLSKILIKCCSIPILIIVLWNILWIIAPQNVVISKVLSWYDPGYSFRYFIGCINIISSLIFLLICSLPEYLLYIKSNFKHI